MSIRTTNIAGKVKPVRKGFYTGFYNENIMAEKNERPDLAACDRTFNVTTDKDVVRIREYSRIVAEKIGFSANERTLIATVVSEICRNIIEYAKTGQVIIQVLLQNSRIGILITAVDNGPGISNIDMAMKDGFSTGRGMGIGLPGSRRIMDDFEIESTPEYGTTVIMRKWLVQ